VGGELLNSKCSQVYQMFERESLEPANEYL
jgi:hypothetical protein